MRACDFRVQDFLAKMKTMRFLVLATMCVILKDIVVDAAPDNSAFKANEIFIMSQKTGPS